MQPAYFDTYAPAYDAHFVKGGVGMAQRTIVHAYLKTILSENKAVLEINCGTGEDATFISPVCSEILCTDISGEMVRIARDKNALLANCSFKVLAIQEIASIEKKFDLLFSNFGGLNCLNEAEMKNFAKDIGNVIKNDGEMLLVIMGRKCIWERFYFSLRGQRAKARRRLGMAKAQLPGSTIHVYYHSPAFIVHIFGADFRVIRQQPVGFFIPPSFLEPFFVRHKFLFSIMCLLEKGVRSFGFLSDYSDHYLIHLKRK